ncbi:MAG: DUF2270 domain-containing protein [Anaerolineales bacterium]|nr:DUF2270 domain-containing protein [Anaerolineales bacterium]
MENLRLWERYAADMMCSMIEQTVKQTDAFHKQVEENVDTFIHTFQPPAEPNSAPPASIHLNGNGSRLEVPSQQEPVVEPSLPPASIYLNGNGSHLGATSKQEPVVEPSLPPASIHLNGNGSHLGTPSQQEPVVEPPPPPAPESPPATPPDPKPAEKCKTEPVWTFRGYQLEAGNFTNAMVHFFRAEVYRADVWRRRLDTTTNWAVITTGATLSIAWDPQIIILSTLLVTLFLYIEARRYRYYELWSYRVRLMETDFFAAMLVPPFRPAADWAESLAENLLRPNFPISMWEAFGRRFRRNYVWIYTILWLAWILNIWLHPEPATSVQEFISRAAIGNIPAWVVLITGLAFNSILIVTGYLTRHLKDAPGEVLPPKEDAEITGLAGASPKNGDAGGFNWKAWCRPTGSRKQTVAFIITDHPETVADSISQDMRRGVTALAGTGMHSADKHNVLMCALTVTEVDHLKQLISRIDPGAFVMLSGAQKVYGDGFVPL